MVDLRQLLRVRYAYAGRFDAGGEHLIFVSDLTGVPQVWGLGKRGWPELLVSPPDRAQTIHAGPRPGQLIVGADVGGDERTQLLYVDGRGSEWRDLTNDRAHIHNFGNFSSDGQRISYSANTRSTRWFDVYVRDLGSGDTRRVLEHDSTNRAGPFSPDGRWLLVTRVFSNAHHELWLVDLEGGLPPKLMSATGEEAIYEQPQWTPDGKSIYCVSDLQSEFAAPAQIDVATGQLSFVVEPQLEIDEARLDPSGQRLAYVVNHDGDAEVRIRSLDTGREEQVTGLPPGAPYAYWQSGLAWDASGQQLSISWTASKMSPNVYTWSSGDGDARQMTFAGSLEINPTDLTEPEHVRYPTFDGREIPALFYAAPGAGADAPCVVFVHGGPEGQYRATFQPVVQYLASVGFAVLAPNVRGSSGYGRTWMHLDDVRKRMDSVADLAHAVYWLRDTRRTDPHRIAVYGGSYGGFMVLAALTNYPDLWAAGVDLVGIANFVTFLENTGPWRRHLREAEYGSLEHDRDFLEDISPINKVDRIRAPLLVIHGANDPRVPISETEQMLARLRSLGRTVEFLRLEDEGHQIAKLKNKLRAYPLAVDFLRRHLMREAAG